MDDLIEQLLGCGVAVIGWIDLDTKRIQLRTVGLTPDQEEKVSNLILMHQEVLREYVIRETARLAVENRYGII